MSLDTILKELENKINNLENEVSIDSFGTVLSATDGIAKISGLPNVASMEMLLVERTGDRLLTLNLESDSLGAVSLGGNKNIKEGDKVFSTGKILSISVGDGVLGRVVDPLMNALDGKGPIKGEKDCPIEKIAPGVSQ